MTRLGFGGAAIGNLYRPVSEAEAAEAIDTAWAGGVRYFDTAPHYGFGLGEQRLGAALARLDPGATAVVSTKVGRLLKPIDPNAASGERHGFVDAPAFEPEFDYSHDGVLRSVESSLQRLGRDRIDILFAHDLGRVTHGEAHAARWAEFMQGGYRALTRLRDEGVVTAIGLGANEAAVCEQALAEGDFDIFLLAGRYTLLEQAPIHGLMPTCEARGVAVVIGGPFNSGVLACAAPSAEPHYDYGAPPAWVIERVEALRAVCDRHGVELPAAALQFPLAHPAVVSVIPGVANPEEARQARRRAAVSLPAALWDDLRRAGLIEASAPTPGLRAAA